MECGKVEGSGTNDNEPVNDAVSNQASNEPKHGKTGRSKKSVTFVQKNKNLLRIFCERHRPFKLIKEIEEKQEAAREELQKF